MSQMTSATTGKKYCIDRVCRCWGISRATVYRRCFGKPNPTPPRRRGPKPRQTDDQVLEMIREDISESPFHGEGHRKIHARLKRQSRLRISRNRVLRIMREQRLLSPYRVPHGKAKTHTGRITTDAPKEMWGTDATKIFTSEDGWVWFFCVIDHWNAECLGWRVAKKGDRFIAYEALREAVKEQYGAINKDIARGLSLRMDHGSQFKSDYFLDHLKYLGIGASFGYVKEPETNGVVERFNRTIKEQAVHGKSFRDIADVSKTLGAFIGDYNAKWMIEKLGYKSPQEAREMVEAKDAA